MGKHALTSEVVGGDHPIPVVAFAGTWPGWIQSAVMDYRGHVGQIVISHGGDRGKSLDNDPRAVREIEMCTELIVRPGKLGFTNPDTRLRQEIMLAVRLGKSITAWETAHADPLATLVAQIRAALEYDDEPGAEA